MDADRFDQFARSLVLPSSRRKAVGALSAGGVLAALFGRSQRALAADTTCVLQVSATIQLGPNKKTTFDGQMTVSINDIGDINEGTLDTEDGISFPVVGQTYGKLVGFRVKVGAKQELSLNGVGQRDLIECTGIYSGTFTGPTANDLGTWQATASADGSTEGDGGDDGGGGTDNSGSDDSGNSGGDNGGGGGGNDGGGGDDGGCASGVVCGGVCCEGAPGLTPDSITCNAGFCECAYSCASAGCDPNGTGTITNTCGSDPEPHCHSECNVPDDGGGEDDADNGATDCGDVQTDNSNCGACGNFCVGMETCIEGVCSNVCEMQGLGQCGSACVNFSIDPVNCGSCANVCAAFGYNRCLNGVCAF